MKTIRPQNNTPTPKLMVETQIKQGDDILIDDNTSIEIVEPTPVPVQVNLSIENLMDEVIATDINENKLKVTILFTERQYNLWKNKGGEKWLKRALVGQKYSPHGRGKKKKK